MGLRIGLDMARAPLSRWGVVEPSVIYVVDFQDWSIRWDGTYLQRHLQHRYDFRLANGWAHFRSRLVHFGSQFTYFLARAYERVHPSNCQVVTWFHGQPASLDPNIPETIRNVPEGSRYARKIVTASRFAEHNLLSWGVEPEKVVRIPLGVDTAHFRPPSPSERQSRRRRLGVPDDAVCIGSFQKDGVGWGEGNEPKLIKGPDIFLEIVSRLAERYKVFVLLTGPARGYVKSGLERMGISYRHDYLRDYPDIVRYYHALDLYLITSRDEGGPKGLLESMATGVPVVASRVGMCPDVLQDSRNGFLVDVEDVDGATQAAHKLIESPALREAIVDQAYRDIQCFDWAHVARQYDELVYRPLLQGDRNAAQTI